MTCPRRRPAPPALGLVRKTRVSARLALAIAACAAPGAVAATAPAVPAIRVDSLFRTRPDSRAALARAFLTTEDRPAQTRSTVYLKAAGEDRGRVFTLGEHDLQAHPWFLPPQWFAALRFRDRRVGHEPAFPPGHIEFSAPHGQHIGVGRYENARRFSNKNDGRPGLSLRGACASDGGEFEVLELTYGAVGLIERFAATFESPACEGFFAYVRGTEDHTGGAPDGAPAPPKDPTPTPDITEVVAEFAADDPRLADLEIPEGLDEPVVLVYGTGDDQIARGRKLLFRADGPEVEWVDFWNPKRRVVDLKLKKPRPDGSGHDRWRIQFMSPVSQVMAERRYAFAGAFPKQAPGFPGIRITGLGNGCGTTGGVFRVLEIKYRADGTPSRFSADFEQHCERSGPPMRGFVIYRAGAGR